MKREFFVGWMPFFLEGQVLEKVAPYKKVVDPMQ
jgi:hypothetical protein